MKESSTKKLIRAVRKLTAEIVALRRTLRPEQKPAAKKAKSGKKKAKSGKKKARKAKQPATSAGGAKDSAATTPN